MAREPFESLPAWRQAMKLSVLSHRLAAALPADEKSGLAAGLKRAAQQPAVLVAQADAAEEPDDALAALGKCEAPLRELITTALLAQQLKMLGRSHLRALRHAVAKLRRDLQDETQAWTQALEEAPAPAPGSRDEDDHGDGNDDFDDTIGFDARPPRRLWPLRRAA